MNQDLINIGLAFLEGFSLIISPCILPILPIILAGSLEGNQKRPLGIIIGFVSTFALFTLFSKEIVQLSGLDLNLVRNISFTLLILLGIIMISSYLTEIFGRLTQKLTNVGSTLTLANNPEAGLLGGILFGGLVGLIWTPCAGPILAAVIVQIIVQTQNLSSFLILLSFAIGASLPMLFIVLFGRKATHRFHFFKQHSHLFRKILGVIVLLSVALMMSNQTLTASEPEEPSALPQNISEKVLINALPFAYPAPEITGIEAWINSNPLVLKNIKAKVILIDFWAYSCINCVRTLPYLNHWYEKYHDKGLEIIGVHSPEFDFEKDLNNVKAAVNRYHIQYPVALDNQFVTWENYHNRFWPAHYLIDENHQVVYQHFGEGNDQITEHNIQVLLGTDTSQSDISSPKKSFLPQSPETYLGFERAEKFSSPEPIIKNQPTQYSYPFSLSENHWALQGEWVISAQKIIATKPKTSIKIHFRAAKVFAVMGTSADRPIVVKALLDGKPVSLLKNSEPTLDNIIVSKHQLYTLIDTQDSFSGVLELQTDEPGLEMYTFTFGD